MTEEGGSVKCGEEHLELDGQREVAVDPQASRGVHHGSVKPSGQDAQAVFAAHRDRHVGRRMGSLADLTGVPFDHQMVLAAPRAAQVELVDGIEAFRGLRIELARQASEKVPDGEVAHGGGV